MKSVKVESEELKQCSLNNWNDINLFVERMNALKKRSDSTKKDKNNNNDAEALIVINIICKIK